MSMVKCGYSKPPLSHKSKLSAITILYKLILTVYKCVLVRYQGISEIIINIHEIFCCVKKFDSLYFYIF